MDEKIIYDTLRNGSDGQGLGALILFACLVAGFIRFVLFIRSARRDGSLPTSSRQLTNSLRQLLSNHATAAIVTSLVVLGVTTGCVLARFAGDAFRLRSGRYSTLEGDLEQDTAQFVSHPRQNALDSAAGTGPATNEKDRLQLAGHLFIIDCSRAWGTPPGMVGQAGHCLDVPIGARLRVDYVQVGPDRYRTYPLRIWRVDP